MNRSEVVLLLTLAGTYDYRKVGDSDVESWFLALDDLPFEDAKAAVIAYYRECTDRLMPAHVRRGVKAIRAERNRQQKHEVRELPSRFEEDMGRQVRIASGAATAREVLAPLLEHLAEKSGQPAGLSALDQLRELTTGPDWPQDFDEETAR